MGRVGVLPPLRSKVVPVSSKSRFNEQTSRELDLMEL